MILSIIVAVGRNNEIGRCNRLLWHLPAELKRFKELTTGHTVVMGRKTFESLPHGPLPNRTNVVLSRDTKFSPENCILFSSLDAALIRLMDEEQVFVIGGRQLYEITFPLADRLYITRVHADFPDADTFFPDINRNEWVVIGRETHTADEKNAHSFTFYEYERKRFI